MAKWKSALESLGLSLSFWNNKKVFITGHTGFKGGWLSLWLQELGAEVHGYALNPPTTPNLFEVANVEAGMKSSTIADIRDADALRLAINKVEPEVIFHLAAQPLVRYSYKAPVETYAVNVMGTVNLLESVRHTPSVKAVVNITTDKCYENKEWLWPYRETEPMGGYDPYSSSKACSELVTAAFRQSFFSESGVGVASARAGNVIGGGDWAQDRLIPDFLKAFDTDQPVIIRAPDSIRPWQHVIEPLNGYLMLAERLYLEGESFAGAWNFGPSEQDERTVGWIVQHLVNSVSGASWRIDASQHVHEARHLKLDSSKARTLLGWQPRWSLDIALDKIVEWHQKWHASDDMRASCIQQINAYTKTELY